MSAKTLEIEPDTAKTETPYASPIKIMSTPSKKRAQSVNKHRNRSTIENTDSPVFS